MTARGKLRVFMLVGVVGTVLAGCDNPFRDNGGESPHRKPTATASEAPATQAR